MSQLQHSSKQAQKPSTQEQANRLGNTTTPVVKLHNSAVAQAVQQNKLQLSLSPLLGCDYVFVSHKQDSELLTTQQITSTIQELIEILELSPRQSVLVSVDERVDGHMVFTRHDYTWSNSRVTQVITTRVTVQEQIDFMLMMFNCSSAC